MKLIIELEDIKEDELSSQLGEDVNHMISRLMETKVRETVKAMVETQFRDRIVTELELKAHTAVLSAIKNPGVQERLDTYAAALVHDVVKRKVMAQTEAWLREAANHE